MGNGQFAVCIHIRRELTCGRTANNKFFGSLAGNLRQTKKLQQTNRKAHGKYKPSANRPKDTRQTSTYGKPYHSHLTRDGTQNHSKYFEFSLFRQIFPCASFFPAGF
jgi:hypothetical protein